MKTHALYLANKYGFAVLPVIPHTKQPIIKNWPKLATSDEQQITEWWDAYPNANIGVATGLRSGIFVMDVDVDKGGLASLEELMAHDEWAPTLTSKTGTGGFHFLFRWDPANPVGNSVSRLAPGIDIRGEGGFIVAPPSIHPNGNRYEWI